MNSIEVTGKVCFLYKRLAKKTALKVLEIMNQPDGLEVAIDFVSGEEIKRLNSETRNIDRVTDVLSYPAFEIKAGDALDLASEEVAFLKTENGFVHFGDMALCFEQCKKQAKEYGVSVKSEIKKLVIHSMLHLMGYDHIEDADFEIMNKKEQEIAELI